MHLKRVCIYSNVSLKVIDSMLPRTNYCNLYVKIFSISPRFVLPCTLLPAKVSYPADQEELGRMIEKYPKLVQKFAFQPHLCYDLMGVWEENCLDLLLNDELVSFYS